MNYYDNFSMRAIFYACIHGSYGLVWVLKGLFFPDPSFYTNKPFSFNVLTVLVLFIYYLLPIYTISSEDRSITRGRMLVVTT